MCPVEDGVIVLVKLSNGAIYSNDIPAKSWFWRRREFEPYVTSYQIIDKEYHPKEDEYLRTEDEYLPKEDWGIYTYKTSIGKFLDNNCSIETIPAGSPVIEIATWPTQTEIQQRELIKHLEFLQILANKFPEIKDKVVEYMNIELKCWWHETSGHLTYEEQEGE